MRHLIEIEEPDWDEMERLYGGSETEEEWKRRMAEAGERGRIAQETEPRAASARYDAETGRIEIQLLDGCTFAFPTHLAQDLRGAPPELLAKVKVMGAGYALIWDELDVGFSVPGLLERRFGNDRWMAMLARERSEAKQLA